MLELEVKILNEDLNVLKDSKIQNKGLGYLRIRETKNLLNDEETTTLTFKKDLKGKTLKENLEINLDINNKENMIKIFEELGYFVVAVGFKDRTSYEYENIRFDLDIWDKETYPYPYMEIEVSSEEDLQKAISLLEIDKKNISKKSITELQKDLK